jgi:penicillin-binding protein 2
VTSRQDFHPFVLQRRGAAAVSVLAAVFLLLGLAFFRLQVLQHDQYSLRSESNRLRPVPLPAPRGLITDRVGGVIAENVPGYSVLLLAASEDSLRAHLELLASLVALDGEQLGRVIERFRAAPYEPTLVVKDAPFGLVSRLEERRAVLPGLVIQTEPKRHYPDSGSVAHLVGYVGEVSEQELAGPLAGRRLGAIVGKVGLERRYEDSLAGEDGVRFVEVDARGRMVREEGAPALPPVPGHPVRTTISLDLQRFVASIFPRERRGALVAMDPRTGAILALYSSPPYDPNAFVGGVPRQLWRQLNEDAARPLLNRAIAARYPPASTFKLAIAAMGLRRGVVRVESRMPQPCRGGIQIGNRFFRCWKPEGHGSLDLIGAVASSCDVYFYQLGLRLGLDRLLEDGTEFGFQSASGVDLPGELASIFPSGRDYYDRVYGPGRWTGTVAVNLAIGQGENAQTLMNMVRFYAALANGGEVPTPHLMARPSGAVQRIALEDTTFLELRRAMIAVVQRGTARAVRLERIQLAGKTGTAQNPHGLDHGWFIGFAPAEHPVIVVGAIMEFAEHGTTVAPYVARVIERYILGADSVEAGEMERLPLAIPRDTVPSSFPVESVPGRAGPSDSVRPR